MTLPPMDPTPDLVRRWKSDRQLVTDGYVSGRVISYVVTTSNNVLAPGEARVELQLPTGDCTWRPVSSLRELGLKPSHEGAK